MQLGPRKTIWRVLLAAWTWSQCSSTPCSVCCFFSNCISYNSQKNNPKNYSKLKLIYKCWITQKSKFHVFVSLWIHVLSLLCVAHTPDNTFLGFVVQHQLSSQETEQLKSTTRQNQALVYGKHAKFWEVTADTRNQSPFFTVYSLFQLILFVKFLWLQSTLNLPPSYRSIPTGHTLGWN